MPLTTEEMNMVMVDLMNGRVPPRVSGPEADKLRESLKDDARAAREAGWVLDVPAEWPGEVQG